MPDESPAPQPSISQPLGKHSRNWKKILLILLILSVSVSLIGVGLYLLIPRLTENPTSQSQPKKESTTSATKKEKPTKYNKGLYFAKDNSIYQADYEGQNQKLIFQKASEEDYFVYDLSFSATGSYLTWASVVQNTGPFENRPYLIFYYVDTDKRVNTKFTPPYVKSGTIQWSFPYDLSQSEDLAYFYSDDVLQKISLESVKTAP